MQEGNHPGSHFEPHTVQAVNHRFRVWEALRVKFQIAVFRLPAVIDLQHVVRESVCLDLAGKIEHSLLVDEVFVLRPGGPHRFCEQLRRRGSFGMPDLLNQDPLSADQVLGHKKVERQIIAHQSQKTIAFPSRIKSWALVEGNLVAQDELRQVFLGAWRLVDPQLKR